MAEIVPTIFANKLDALISEEANLLGVKDQLESLLHKLKFLGDFLRDAEEKHQKFDDMELWIRQIREVTYEAEDAIDAYMLRLEQRRNMNLLRKWLHSPNFFTLVHRTEKQIEGINTRLHDISSECRLNYATRASEITQDSEVAGMAWRQQGTSEITQDSEVAGMAGQQGTFEITQDSEVAGMAGQGMAWRQQGTSEITQDSDTSEITQDSEVAMADESIYEAVGFKNESEKLVKLLKEADLQLKIISIIGKGGWGKTTLANKIYRNHDACRRFDVQLWITVSQRFQLKDLLLSLLKQLNCATSGMEKEDNQSLKNKLRDELAVKKYLLIIDDIWKVEAWEQICGVFLDKSKGSRIILTTRNKEEALYANPDTSRYASDIELCPLNTDDSFELFCRKVFSKPIVGCPPELVSLGKEIVSQCDGLPLAIVVIGGLLKVKERKPDAWCIVLESVKWYLSQDTNSCHQILMSSYSDLPSYLKSCFLYLGLFPEDFSIDVKKLVRLLVAEGFVPTREQLTTEVVAEDCVKELVQRCLIEVKDQGDPISLLQMHGLLRDIATTEGKKNNFIDTASNIGSRRLAIHPGTSCKDGNFPITDQNLRSLLFFVEAVPTFSTNPSKMLRVLDLEGVNLSKGIPMEIGELGLLHYLGLANTGIKSLPSWIGKLIKLQTLDVGEVFGYNITNSIWKLKNLRHLLIYGNDTEGVVGDDFGRNLLTLAVQGGMWLNKSGLLDVLVKHECLRSLEVRGNLELNSGGRKVKTYIPSSLTELVLYYTLIKEDPSEILGSLPSLKSLSLDYKSFTGMEMVFRKGSFPKLQYLYLCGLEYLLNWRVEDGSMPILTHLEILRLDQLKKLVFRKGNFPKLQYLYLCDLEYLLNWRVEDGSMPILTHLKILRLYQLKKLPDGLRNVTSLQRIEVYETPQLEERIKENGEEWDIIKHVQLVQYFGQGQDKPRWEARTGGASLKLHSLEMNGKLENLKLSFLSSLIELVLDHTYLEENPSDILGRLPSLKSLSLEEDSFTGTEMVFRRQSFRELQYLYLCGLKCLLSWEAERGSIPILTHLQMCRLTKLKSLPNSLKELGTKLQRIEVFFMPQLERDCDSWFAPLVQYFDYGDKLTHKSCFNEKLEISSKNLKTYFPSSLTELVLQWTFLEEDPSDILGSLPSLKSLTLDWKSYTGKEMVFRKGSFPQLHYLNLSNLWVLLDWRVEDGSMPILTHLKIDGLRDLKKLPDGLRSITSLQRIEMHDMPQLEEIIKEKGEDWDIIKHVPLVQYFNYSSYQDELVFEMRLGRYAARIRSNNMRI